MDNIIDKIEHLKYPARFELYSIVVDKLTPDRRDLVRKISRKCHLGNEVIYNAEDDEEGIPVGKPLSLAGPARPCEPYSSVHIRFGEWNLGWGLRIKWDDEKDEDIDRPVRVEVKDRETDSSATVLYEVMSKCLDARFKLRYVDEDNRVIRITRGEVIASRDHVACTTRVLRSFDGLDVSSGEEIQLEKSVMAVHIVEKLYVSVNLEYELLPPSKRNTLEKTRLELNNGTINKTFPMAVPEEPGMVPMVFFDDDFPLAKLILDVNWRDDLYAPKKYTGPTLETIWQEALQLEEAERLKQSTLKGERSHTPS